MGTSCAEAPKVEVRPAIHVTSELGLGGGEMVTFKTAGAREDTPVLEARASALHGDRSEQAGADRGGEGTAAPRGGKGCGPDDGGGSRRPLGRQTQEPQREGDLAESRRQSGAVALAQSALAAICLDAFSQVDALDRSAETRCTRREIKERGRDEQRRRMHLYLRAAVSVPPAERQPTRRVAFEAGAAAPVRVPKLGKRKPFQIAPAEASAFCLPESTPARPAETGGDEEH